MSKKKIVHVNKTKEQIIRDAEIARKSKIIIDEFYPALNKATISIDESKYLIQAISNIMMQETIGTMKSRKFSELYDHMFKELTQDGEREEEIKNLLNIFKNENLYDAREIIEGMTRAIEQIISDEMRGRKLETFKADWGKMLNK